MKRRSQLKKACNYKLTLAFCVCFNFLFIKGFSQAAVQGDTCIYHGIKLHNFYGLPFKKLLTEIESKNKILNCGYKKRKKSMVVGIAVQIADSSEMQVYFKTAIYEPLKGSACGNKTINSSVIDYFVISYFNGSKRIVARRKAEDDSN
jgi:hypothetical protein